MRRETTTSQAAIGFRVRSGWATAVLLVGTVRTPQALDHRVVHLSDAADPETKQPYHAAMGTMEEDPAKIQRRTKAVERATAASVAELLHDYRALNPEIRVAGLVVGSQIDPAKIANPHIRAHALEGRLFRTALEDALQAHALPSVLILEHEAYARAAAALGRSEAEVKQALVGLRGSLAGSWRAEEKLAALAAWLALA
jgi:hypothetical protein